MNKILYLLVFIFSFSVLSAQQKLSKEEQDRREKNIQAGNPFAKYGYKARIATLSKGKYLEAHDLDSIVTIGTTRWDVDHKKIVGTIVQDSLNPDAQPIGDRAGRWISPDPLSEEFPSWSPYVSFNNNPVKFTDPTGMATENCCDGLFGFVAGTISNLTGSNYLRKGEHSRDFNNGAKVSDAVSLAGGTYLSAKGVIDASAGGAGMTMSATATAVSGGLAIEVTGPAFVESAKLTAVGLLETAVGGFIANNAVNNMRNDDSSTSSSSTERTGRGSNNRTPDKDAVGDHTVRNEKGSTTYKVEPNNPNKNNNGVGFKTEKRVDYTGAAHVNKKTGVTVETPHVQQNGNVRPAIPGRDMPR
jgi:hypothetical protein